MERVKYCNPSEIVSNRIKEMEKGVYSIGFSSDVIDDYIIRDMINDQIKEVQTSPKVSVITLFDICRELGDWTIPSQAKEYGWRIDDCTSINTLVDKIRINYSVPTAFYTVHFHNIQKLN